MKAQALREPAVRPIGSGFTAPDKPDESELRTVSAKLRITTASLARLLSVSGSQTDFLLAAADGSTTVRVGLAVSSVPDGELTVGNHGVTLDWSRSTLSYGPSRISLTRMELRLLIALMELAPSPAPHAHLIGRLWPTHSEVQPGNLAALAVWISALRRRFSALGLPHAIRTVRSVGYCLTL